MKTTRQHSLYGMHTGWNKVLHCMCSLVCSFGIYSVFIILLGIHNRRSQNLVFIESKREFIESRALASVFNLPDFQEKEICWGKRKTLQSELELYINERATWNCRLSVSCASRLTCHIAKNSFIISIFWTYMYTFRLLSTVKGRKMLQTKTLERVVHFVTLHLIITTRVFLKGASFKLKSVCIIYQWF